MNSRAGFLPAIYAGRYGNLPSLAGTFASLSAGLAACAGQSEVTPTFTPAPTKTVTPTSTPTPDFLHMDRIPGLDPLAFNGGAGSPGEKSSLPQLAAFGDSHWQVQKVISDGRTLTRVKGLQGEARLIELAQMLGEISEGTLRSAHEILQTAQAVTVKKV